MPAERPEEMGDERRDAHRIDVLLVLLALAVLRLFVQMLSAQPASRYALTAALWDHQTVNLGRYREVLGVDQILVDGCPTPTTWTMLLGPAGRALHATLVAMAATALIVTAGRHRTAPRHVTHASIGDR